jgi:cell division protein FtsZ
MEVDDEFVASKPVAKIVEEVIPAEMNITMKQVETSTNAASKLEISPMEMTIEETLSLELMKEEKIKRIQL